MGKATGWRLAWATAGLLALAGCDISVDTAPLEAEIKAELGHTGVVPTSVDCPDRVEVNNGSTFICTATADDGGSATITVTWTSDAGETRWEVTDLQPPE